jgi:hypothetical protein
VKLATPVAVVPTERYVVTYHTARPFALETMHLRTARVSGNLTANANGDPVGYGNALYKNETGHTFPTTSSNGHSYFADVVFQRSWSGSIAPGIVGHRIEGGQHGTHDGE